MKKSCEKLFVVLAVLLAVLLPVTVSASYDPATKAEQITYRNFFSTARDIMVNGKTITAEDYPAVTLVNEGARQEDETSYYSEANYNGAVFLFANANVIADSNVISLFYDYDQRHGDVRSCEYNIYVAAPGTAIEEAMTSNNEIAVLSYDKEEQIWEEVATDTWTDFYSEANAGPMTGIIDLKAGVYDIYVKVNMIDVDDTFEDGNMKDLSAKLAEIDFMNDPNVVIQDSNNTEPPVATVGPTASNSTEPPASNPAEDSTDELKETATMKATEDNKLSQNQKGGISPVVIVIVIVAVLIVAGGIVFIVMKKKKEK